MNITFAQPEYLWILAAVPVIIVTHFFTLSRSRATALKIANFEALERVSKGDFLGSPYKGLFRNRSILLLLIRMFTYCLLIFSISGATLWYVGKSSSFDFVLAVDTSSSMLAQDFAPNRLEAAKGSAVDFINAVPSRTRIGLVSFSGVPVIELKPVEKKHEIINKTMNLKASSVGGTDIGDALIVASSLFERSGGRSGVIILLTDGRSNVGTSVDDAVSVVKAGHIVVHTIGVATAEGGAFINDTIVSRIDEASLTAIANQTGGTFYLAQDKSNLEKSFGRIASITDITLSLELSWMLLVAGLVLLSVEWVLMNTRYRTIP